MNIKTFSDICKGIIAFFRKRFKREEIIDKIPDLTCNVQEIGDEIKELTHFIKGEFEKTNDSFKDVYTKLGEMTNENKQIHEQIQQIALNVNKVQRGVQRELFDTLRRRRQEAVCRGWMPASDKIEFQMIYDNYHELGANGLADTYYNETMSMPETEEEWRIKNNV